MATKQLYGDRNYNGDVVTNHTFTVFADLAAATAVVANVYGFAFMADTGTLYYNQTGLAWQPIGAKGAKGDTGVAGNTVLSGSGAPSGGTGVDGDFYIDTAAAEIYGPKTAGVWGSPTSLTGPAGPAGADGADGNTVLSGTAVPSAGLGVDGDFYLRTTTFSMYGPKTAGSWGPATSLVGPMGPAGPVGDTGPEGPPGPPGASTGVTSATGSPESRTDTGTTDPVSAPVGADPRYYFNTTDLTLFKWNSESSEWDLTSESYLDTDSLMFYEASLTMPEGWTYRASLGASPVQNAVVNATGQVTPADLVTIVPADSSGGAITITLPTTPKAGQVICIKDVGGSATTNVITVAAHGTDKLDGVASGTTIIDVAYGAVWLYHASTYEWLTIHVYRGPRVSSATINSATSLAAARDRTVLYDVSGGAFAIDLPSTPREGDRVRFKNKTNSTNTLTINGTVDGTPNPTCTTAYQLYVVEYLGGAWRKMN